MALTFTFGRRRRRVQVWSTGPASTPAAGSTLEPPRSTLVVVVRRRWIPPRITAVHSTPYNAAHQGARPSIVVARAPQPKRITPPRFYQTKQTPNLPLPNRVQPRPLVVHRLDRLTRSKPLVVWSGLARVASLIPPPPPIVLRIQPARRSALPSVIKKSHARPSIQPFAPNIVVVAPRAPKRPQSFILLTSCKYPQAYRPKPIGLTPPIVVRFAPRLPAKFYIVSTRTVGPGAIRSTRPLIVIRPRQPVRAIAWLQINSGSGVRPSLPIRPLFVPPPAARRQPPRAITPALHYPLASPPRHDPLPRINVFALRRGQGPRWGYLPIIENPAQPIPGVNPPIPGGLPMAPDLIAACIAWLRLQPAIVAAFGDAVGTEKFGSDIASRSTNPPYLEFYEPEEDEGYETQDSTGEPSSLAEGSFFIDLLAPQSLGKLGTRQLAEQVVAVLNDAPLTFLDGVLVYLRRSKRKFPTFKTQGPGGNVVMWKRILEFEYKIERYVT